MRPMKDSGGKQCGMRNSQCGIKEKWAEIKLKYLFEFGKGLPITRENLVENGLSVISYGQIHSKINSGTCLKNELERFVDKKYLETNADSLVHKGDFIFADTSEDLDGCGNFVYVDKEKVLFGGYHTIILKCKNEFNGKFLAYLFSSDFYRQQLRVNVFGIKVFSITQKILKETILLLPNKPEQQAIADKLDKGCGEIDNVIAKTKAVVEEYKKLKQAVITEAVTGEKQCGMRNSQCGIKEKWAVIKLRFITNCIGDVDHYMPQTVDDGIPYVMTGDLCLKVSKIDFDSCKKISRNDYYDLSKKLVAKKGDVIFARYATIGTVCYVDIDTDFIISYSCVVIKPCLEKVNSEYLCYYFQSIKFCEDVRMIKNSNTQDNLGIEDLYSVKIVVPPLPEQQAIVAYLDAKCGAIDELIAKKQQLIREMENYKKSVIYEYVTGKKEVG